MADNSKYSSKIPGSEGNYNWPVKYNKARGYVGTWQKTYNGKIERVDLSPAQLKQLIAFAGPTKSARAK